MPWLRSLPPRLPSLALQLGAVWRRRAAGKVRLRSGSDAADVIISMGLRRRLSVFPGKRYEDCKLDNPAAKGVDPVRPNRDEIRDRVRDLLIEPLPASGTR